RARAPEIGEHLLLCLLAHRAGVEQDDVGVLDAVGPARAFARRQDVGHAVGVVLVHLAPEGADVQLLRHRLLLRSRAAASSAGVRIQTRAIWPEASSATRTSYVPDSDAGITMRLFASWMRAAAARRTVSPSSTASGKMRISRRPSRAFSGNERCSCARAACGAASADRAGGDAAIATSTRRRLRG